MAATVHRSAAVNNGDRAGLNWGNGGGWNDATDGVFPDWVQINFSGPKTIDHVIVYTMQDNYASPVDPPDTLTFSLYGITDFQVQGWNGSAWVTLGSVTGNNLVKRQVNFAATTTDRIRVNVTGAPGELLAHHRDRGLDVEREVRSRLQPRSPARRIRRSVGTSVTFTATVTGVAPTGSVNFTDGGTSIAGCSAVALTGSGNTRTAACSTSALTAGTHSIVGSLRRRRRQCRFEQQCADADRERTSRQINVALAANGGVATASSTYSVGGGYR